MKELDRIFSHIDSESEYYYSSESICDFRKVDYNLKKLDEIKLIIERFANGGVMPLECIEKIDEVLKQ